MMYDLAPNQICPFFKGPCVGEDCLAYYVEEIRIRDGADRDFELHVCLAMERKKLKRVEESNGKK